MSRKTYKTKGDFNLVTTVALDGTQFKVAFEPRRINGVKVFGLLSTSNPKLQEALESDELFNVKYFLYKESGDPEAVKEEVKAEAPAEPVKDEPVKEAPVQDEPVEPVVTNEPETLPETPVQEPEAVIVSASEVPNVQVAKEWLNKNKGIPFSQMPNKPAIINLALENQVVFEAFNE